MSPPTIVLLFFAGIVLVFGWSFLGALRRLRRVAERFEDPAFLARLAEAHREAAARGEPADLRVLIEGDALRYGDERGPASRPVPLPEGLRAPGLAPLHESRRLSPLARVALFAAAAVAGALLVNALMRAPV